MIQIEDDPEINLSIPAKLDEELKATLKKYETSISILEQAKQEHVYKKENLEKSHKATVGLLLTSFEDHLKKSVVAPTFVNIQVTLSLPSKHLVFEHVSLRPTTTASDIRQLFIEKFNQRGGEHTFVEYRGSMELVVHRPMSCGGESFVMADEAKPLSLYDVPQGSTIVMTGRVILAEDMPKQCFSMTFRMGDVTDYYKCNDCSLNWICKVCADHCHRGHNISVFIQNHKPTYACCYDSRKGSCKLINK
eukprot:gene15518-18430_t